jgi:predicted dehydrogenase
MEKKLHPPLRAGVVGCGGISQIIHIPLLAKNPLFQLVALCDVDDRKLAFLTKRYKNTQTYRDIEEMLRNVELDVLFILTPTNMHVPMALMALKRGIHLFIERPVARNAVEAKRIFDAAQKAGCHVMVGMQSRFRNDYRTLKGFVDNQSFGELIQVKAEWLQSTPEIHKQPWVTNKQLSGGGVIFDLGVQLLDTCWWLIGKPKLLSATTFVRQIKPKIRVEDNATFYLRFDNKVDVTCSVSWFFPLAKDRTQLEIIGADGYATAVPFKVQKFVHGKNLDITPPIYETYPGALYKLAYQNSIHHFANFLIGKDKRLFSDLADAIKIMEMVDLIYQSMETGNTAYANKK